MASLVPLKAVRLAVDQTSCCQGFQISLLKAHVDLLEAKPGDALILCGALDEGFRLFTTRIAHGALCSSTLVHADLAAAVVAGSAPLVVSKLRASTSGLKDSEFVVGLVPSSTVRTATGLSVRVSPAEERQGAFDVNSELPVALLLAQLPFLLDGVYVSQMCTLPLEIAGRRYSVNVVRATPAGALILRVASEYTRFTVDDGTALATRLSASPAASPSMASLSRWKQPLRSPSGVGATPATPGGDSIRAPVTPLAPWKTPLKSAPVPEVAPAVTPSPLVRSSFVSDNANNRRDSAAGTPMGSNSEPAIPVEDPPVTPVPLPSDLRVAGLDSAYASLHELVILPFTPRGRDLLAALRLTPPAGVLLHGPPGCGKTHLVRAIAAAARAEVPGLRVRLFSVGGPEVLSPVIGEPERRLRELFDSAHAHASGDGEGAGKDVRNTRDAPISTLGRPSPTPTPAPGLSIIFLDEVDALCPKRLNPSGRVGGPGGTAGAGAGAGSAVSTRVTTQLLTLMDGARKRGSPPGDGRSSPNNGNNGDSGDFSRPASPAPYAGRVVVIAATNRPDALDPALRRPGRLEREVRIHPPDASARSAILALHAGSLPLDSEARGALPSLAEGAVGYVGADLAAVCREAANRAVERALTCELPETQLSDESLGLPPTVAAGGNASSPPQLEPRQPCVTLADLHASFRHVGASCLRGMTVFATTTRWEDIGGMGSAIARLREAVELPLQHAQLYRRMGLAVPRGILLHGPPGNAKTTLVRALATSIRASFLSLSGADVYSPYVGEAEATLRAAFATARSALPCVLFLDEVDALVGSRGIGGSGGSGGGHDVSTGILATLLTEMDGVAGAEGILVVAATNRPHALDPALLRPGRLELHIHVPLPDEAGRVEILGVHTRAVPLAPDVDLRALAAATGGFSGAELEGLCREAAMAGLRGDLACAAVTPAHVDAALRALGGSQSRGKRPAHRV